MATVRQAATRIALQFRVRGAVQGVGFRPFVYRLARELEVWGWVRNDHGGVLIHAEGLSHTLVKFEALLSAGAPEAARVTAVERRPGKVGEFADFRILSSTADGGTAAGVRVPPDRAACARCVQDVFAPGNRRYGHPFATCTDCGPRYSIIDHMPYDRPHTTMASFALCPACATEYGDPGCRRFHAQPIACPACGPRVALWDRAGCELATADAALSMAAVALRRGEIVALKGLGGYQFLVRADSSAAVRRLRERKGRPTKPFAVMVPSLPHARQIARIGSAEEALLTGPENPIVLLRRLSGTTAALAPEVAPRLNRVGLLLPTTPLHHLLLAEIDFPVVATSGNLSEEPIVVAEREALTRLTGVGDVFLVHDRPIARRVDDSVACVVGGQTIVIRLARGYAPLALPALEEWAARRLPGSAPAVVALGGQQKTAIALWNGAQAVLSPHLGDLDDPGARQEFVRLVDNFADLYGASPAVLACDLHPDYFTTRWAERQGRRLIRVQHHHAHAVACMAEHGLLDREVLAFTWDGTGYGLDGTVWGGEMLRVGVTAFERVASLRPFPLVGGEAAVREPARVALAILAQTFGPATVLADADLLDRLGLSHSAARNLLRMAERGVNTPWTTSMGRLFDGIAALLLGVGKVSYEGEAAAWLEAAAAEGEDEPDLSLPCDGVSANRIEGDWRPLVRDALAAFRAGVAVGWIANQFHQALANWAVAVATSHPDLPIVLGGGCFQNTLLLERIRAGLEGAGRTVYGPGLVPSNDGGLAVGQLAVALASLAAETTRNKE